MAEEERQKRIALYVNDYKAFPLIMYKGSDLNPELGPYNVVEDEEHRVQRICKYVDQIFKP